MNLVKGLTIKSDEEWLRQLKLFSLEKAESGSFCVLQLPERML